MTTTLKTAARYALALIAVLVWFALLQVACLCDRETAAAVKAGESIDHLDAAVARLDVLHVELFGSDE